MLAEKYQILSDAFKPRWKKFVMPANFFQVEEILIEVEQFLLPIIRSEDQSFVYTDVLDMENTQLPCKLFQCNTPFPETFSSWSPWSLLQLDPRETQNGLFFFFFLQSRKLLDFVLAPNWQIDGALSMLHCDKEL